MTPTTSSSRLVPNTIPQQPCNPPNKDDWDCLFQPMFDEYINPPTIVVSLVPTTTEPRAVDIAESPILCGYGAHIGYNCPPKALIISNPEQFNQTINVLPQTLPSVHPICNSGDENSFTYDSKPNSVDDSPNVGQIMQKKEEERRIAKDQVAKDRYWKIPICYDDDDDYTIAITLILSTKEVVDSLIMKDEHLDTIPATVSDEVIKSSVGNLVQILTSTLNLEIVSLEEENEDQEEKEFDLEDIFQIQDVIFCEKLLNISCLVINIESLKDNPTPDHVFKSPFSFPIPVMDSDSFFEEFDTSLSYSDNSLPKFETFSDDMEETRSGSTTTHANNSLPEYIISFELSLIRERCD
ncbi:hypothetical protein Tco_0762127 [Tanacetum coccineum]